MSWWTHLFGRSSNGPTSSEAAPNGALDALIAASTEARRRYWSRLGTVDADVLGQLIASRFIPDMPVWPSGREVYLVVRRENTVILATDGLSDPDDGEFRDRNGYGLEVFIEAPAAALTTPIGSPYLDVLIQVARNIAYSGGIVEPWSKYQLLSMELPTEKPDARLVNDEGHHILLLGMPGFDQVPAIEGMPLSQTKAMAVTIVHPDDFAKVAREGGQGRVRLAAALAQSGHGHVSDFARQPVL
jgi:hypothetical protein